MATDKGIALFRLLGLGSTRRSILMLVLSWILNVAWLGFNYFWRLVPESVLIAIPVLLLLYGLLALVAYIYWGIKGVREQDEPYASIMVGAIVAITLLYLNYTLLDALLSLSQS
ncbi:hypothetical protein [Pontibacter lucknowensis]|uniref:Uncharacterized protein n=1 Tax=Pontibacter lucknowensis TaxID=1077936 RepID=A0A1N6TST3_9BACT|nr:hypothetical protein [Pontibacter lucknowensis]SIQ56403.1 hypothetical protein SAMN05421545_0490 [Pontibacter lucknowensis]